MTWYSTPDIWDIPQNNSISKMLLLTIIDAHHKLCGLRPRVCTLGLPNLGIKREAWVKAAQWIETKLCVPMVEDLIDTQNSG